MKALTLKSSKKLYSMMNNPLIAEFIGTAILLLLGCGIVANVNLKENKS